jgi:hypothetical protein
MCNFISFFRCYILYSVGELRAVNVYLMYGVRFYIYYTVYILYSVGELRAVHVYLLLLLLLL